MRTLMRPLKKWPLLFRHYDTFSGRPHQSMVKLVDCGCSTEHVWVNCAGSDSDEHIRSFRQSFPAASPASIRQAIAFERSLRQ